MVGKTRIIIVIGLLVLFLPTQILGTQLAGIGRSLTREIQDTKTIPCEQGHMSVRDRGNFELGQPMKLRVSTSQCPLFIELLDRFNWGMQRRGMAYAAIESLDVPPSGFVDILPPKVQETWGVVVRVNSSLPSSSTVILIWTYPYLGPSPSETILAVGLLLVSSISAFLALVVLVRETQRPVVGGVLAALIGIAFPLSFYAFAPSTAGRAYIAVNHLVWSSIFLGLSSYFVTRRVFPRMALGWRLAVAIVGYLIVGAAIITLAAPLAIFAGVPIVLIPFWPTGVFFMFFAEQLYSRSLLMWAVWVIWTSAVALGIGVMFLPRAHPRQGSGENSVAGDSKSQR